MFNIASQVTCLILKLTKVTLRLFDETNEKESRML